LLAQSCFKWCRLSGQAVECRLSRSVANHHYHTEIINPQCHAWQLFMLHVYN
jgi:hypothetical protein